MIKFYDKFVEKNMYSFDEKSDIIYIGVKVCHFL